MKAGCTFPSCPAKYSFTVQNNPVASDQDVQILVQQTGDIQHKLSETKARPATIQKRGKIAKALTHGPSQLYYSTLQSTPKEQLLAGNMTECLNKKVLKVIGSEMRKKAIHSLWYLHGNLPSAGTTQGMWAKILQNTRLHTAFQYESVHCSFEQECSQSVASAFLCIICEVGLLWPSILMPLEELSQKYQTSRSVCCTMQSFFQERMEKHHLFLFVKCSPMITQYHQSHFGSCNLHCICQNTHK